MTVLCGMSLIVLLVLAAFLVDIAWMSVIQSEAQLASDVATRGALTAFVNDRSNNNYAGRVRNAQAVGETIFESFEIGSDVLDVDPTSFQFGHRNADDVFVEKLPNRRGRGSASAVRLELPNANPNGFDLFLTPIFGVDQFNTSPSTTVSFDPIDVVLCLDMSRSMAWEVGSQNGPGGVTIHQPVVPGSRWLELVDSVELFLDKAEERSPSLQISLVTFGGGEFKEVPSPWDTNPSRIDTDLDFIFAAREPIRTKMDFITNSVLGWRTPTKEALAQTIIVFDTQSSPASRKILVLLSDGAATTGPPIDAAQTVADDGVTIHTIYFAGTARGEQPMRDIATLGGGMYLDADNTTELDDAFDRILSLLSVRMVE